ncbi:MAG: gamma-glutamyltransferase [Paludibaculum sp.]
MALPDLADYRAEWVVPLSTNYRGWDVYEIPPNSQGIAALIMLNLVEQFPIGAFGPTSVEALHTLIEAKKLAYADMQQHVGDPRFADVPVATLLSKAYARDRAALINRIARCRGRRRGTCLCAAATPPICRSSIATATSCR